MILVFFTKETILSESEIKIPNYVFSLGLKRNLIENYANFEIFDAIYQSKSKKDQTSNAIMIWTET